MMIEEVKMRGDFSIKITKNGKTVEESTEKNLIVTLGKETMAKLLGGSGAARVITKISFGTNGTAAADGDSAITGSVTKAITTVTYPDTNSVQFAWSLEESEGNGTNIAEFGLMSNDLTLFARKARAVIAKTSEIRITGTWKIIF